MTQTIPKHIAIVMDGNGRWATRRRHPRVFGHVRGSSRVQGIVREASRVGVQVLTLYAFSTENWSRPEHERRVLWKLLKKYLAEYADELDAQNVRLRVIGELDRLDSDLRDLIEGVHTRLAQNTGLQLVFALSYGARRELVKAATQFAEDCRLGRRLPNEMSDELMEKYLWTAELGELSSVDLLIRTSGEKRLSNFLLWQSAYAECVFVERCWPDFMPEDLIAAIEEFSRRERRFGQVRGKSPKIEQADYGI